MRSIFTTPVPTDLPDSGQPWPTRPFDVAVVGAGIVGAGIAARLAEAGLGVVSGVAGGLWEPRGGYTTPTADAIGADQCLSPVASGRTA